MSERGTEATPLAPQRGENDHISAHEQTKRVIEGLKTLYKTKLLPLEKTYLFDEFYSPLKYDAEFDAAPMVLMLGQYSVGKTSFIEYLLGESYPGSRIGPEPTTDRFVSVMYGGDERQIPGNALAVAQDSPFHGLQMFGTAFLNKFEAAHMPCSVLKQMTIIDTPGILAGEKQRVSRGYDFTEVVRWFADRCDLILLLFDAHKLDISDEFKRAIEALKGNDDKVRCVLNKADQVDHQKLMRVYGALMWSIGKVMNTPEVARVYIGSFWNEDLLHTDCADLFDKEKSDLMRDLRDLAKNRAIRQINELVKRVRLAKVHACLIGYLKDSMPAMLGKDKKQKEMMDNLPAVFRTVQKLHNLPPGDFPPLDSFHEKLSGRKFDRFPKLKTRMLQDLEEVLSTEIPALMMALPKDSRDKGAGLGKGEANPFVDMTTTEVPFLGDALRPAYEKLYQSLSPNEGGLISGSDCMNPLRATGVSDGNLRRIWDLSDIDQDGMLDCDEFILAFFLCDHVKAGNNLPDILPTNMIPIRKRSVAVSN